MQPPGVLLAACLATLLPLAGPACAEGSTAIVPAPMSARNIDRYASILRMSPPQRLALEVPHDTYLAEFETLRDTEIEAYVKASAKTRYGYYGFLGMTAEQIKTGLDERDRIMRRIRDLDDRLLGAVRVVLTDEQMAELARVELSRERARYGSGMSGLIGRLDPAGRIDLAELVADLDLDTDAWRAVDPAMRAYETQLTAARRRFDQRTDASLRAMANRMVELGIDGVRGPRGSDPRGSEREALDAYRAELALHGDKLIVDLAAIAKLNRRTVRDLRLTLDAETWRDVHDAFYDRGYESAGATDNPGVAYIAAALAEEALAAEFRAGLEDLLVGLYADTDRLTAEGADALAKQRARQPDFLSGRDGAVETRARLAEIAARRATENQAAIRAAIAMIGPALASRLKHLLVDDDAGEDATREEVAAMFPDDEGDAVDPFLPGPISDRDVVRYATWLGLSETKCAILFAMHDDYREAFDGITAGTIRRMLEARERLRSGEHGNADPPDTAARIYRLRRTTLDAIVAADAVFFEDVTLVLTEEELRIMPRVRRDRQRRIYGPRLTAQGASGLPRSLSHGHEEGRIDLGPLLDDVDPAEVRDMHGLDAIRSDYERTVAAIYREGYEANMKVQEAWDIGRAEFTSGLSGDFDWSGYWSEDPRSSSDDAQSQIVALNRRTLLDLREPLSDTAATLLREAYDRRAYPEVFRDDGYALPDIEAALALEDLSPVQRATVQEIAVEFRVANDDLRRRLVANRTAVPLDVRRLSNAWLTQQANRRRADERVESERADLNDKTRLRLKNCLTEVQAARLGL